MKIYGIAIVNDIPSLVELQNVTYNGTIPVPLPFNPNPYPNPTPNPVYPPVHVDGEHRITPIPFPLPAPGDPSNGQIKLIDGVTIIGGIKNGFKFDVPANLPIYQSSAQGKFVMSSKNSQWQMEVSIEVGGVEVVPPTILGTDFTIWFAIDRSTGAPVQLERGKDVTFWVKALQMPAGEVEKYTLEFSSPAKQQTVI